MSVYPGAIPSSGDLPDAGANLSSNPHSSLHDDVRDEVIAIATELGVEPSGTEATVRARLDAGLGLREIVTFTSDGTFTKASYPWLRAVRVRCQGGGGGGGAVQNTSNQPAGAGGGAGGTYRESFILAADLPATVSVTRGDGGAGGTGSANGVAGTTSLFGSLLNAPGGAGGLGSPGSAFAATLVVAGGTANVGGTGQIVVAGTDGGNGISGISGTLAYGGHGGGSHLGGGGRPSGDSTGGAGSPGKLYGGGGGGAFGRGASYQHNGGAGANGIVIVELYA